MYDVLDIQPCLRHLGNSERVSPTLKRWARVAHPSGMNDWPGVTLESCVRPRCGVLVMF